MKLQHKLVNWESSRAEKYSLVTTQFRTLPSLLSFLSSLSASYLLSMLHHAAYKGQSDLWKNGNFTVLDFLLDYVGH